MGFDALRDLPRILRLRLRNEFPPEPWMVHSAVQFLAGQIQNDWRVLELGAGRSTEWFCSRAGLVVSLEDDATWHEDVLARLRRQGVRNCRLELAPLDSFPNFIKAQDDQSFELVVVDHNHTQTVSRVDSAVAAMPKVKPEGFLVFDDFDRPAYRRADRWLQSWEERRFVGIKGFPLAAVETAIFRRPETWHPSNFEKP